MINLNPAELSSKWTFVNIDTMKAYEFDAFGNRIGGPSALEALRAVAANPVACAHMVHAYVGAFGMVFLGWPLSSKHQTNPHCIFGVIVIGYFKYESSGRGGKHAHGQILQPPLQAANLRRLLSKGDEFQERLFEFLESFACSYLPWPSAPPSNVVESECACLERWVMIA